MSSPRAVIIIPARYQSSRFPGKPLALIRGRSMIERVRALALRVRGVADVIVATDDDRIFSHVEAAGGRVLMTGESRNGSERAWQAATRLSPSPEIIINLQGDSPLTPPWVIEALVEAMARDTTIELATPACRLTVAQYEAMSAARATEQHGGTLVTFDRDHRALYFSRALIPTFRTRPLADPIPAFKHIGIYAYRSDTLQRYLELPPTPLEEAESLEQLRALEHGIPIRVVEVDLRGRTPWSVDTPADLTVAEEILDREGELPE